MSDQSSMHDIALLFSGYGLQTEHMCNEVESRAYNACRFSINGHSVLYRQAKITPKKTGQFVTTWNRDTFGVTQPFHQDDRFDYFIIRSVSEENTGLFIFPKKILVEQGILSSDFKEGKRGFRLYGHWDKVQSKQAIKTMEWQVRHFIRFGTGEQQVIQSFFKP